MAKRQKSKYRQDTESRIIELLSATAGGVVGNQGTNWLEKQTFLGSFAPHAPAITAFAGALLYVLTPQTSPTTKALAYAGLGMAIVGGTEEAEKGIGQLTGALGYTPEQLGLGFTPQVLPPGARMVKQMQGAYAGNNNVPVR